MPRDATQRRSDTMVALTLGGRSGWDQCCHFQHSVNFAYAGSRSAPGSRAWRLSLFICQRQAALCSTKNSAMRRKTGSSMFISLSSFCPKTYSATPEICPRIGYETCESAGESQRGAPGRCVKRSKPIFASPAKEDTLAAPRVLVTRVMFRSQALLS